MKFIKTYDGSYINAAQVTKWSVAPYYGMYGDETAHDDGNFYDKMPGEKFFVYADDDCPIKAFNSFQDAMSFLDNLIAQMEKENLT